jgi:amino-acid N-acetyltransferase
VGPGTPGDLPAILNLLRRSKLPTEGLEHHIQTTLIARLENGVVGCAAIERYGSAGLLRSVAVDERHRGTGLGQALTRAALELARAYRLKTVYLLTETAAEFFPKFGFQTVARDAVDSAVKQSIEFTKLCPSSATAMRLDLPTTP